nr:uncharacterized protein LOC111416034 [Onthophagus taurus]
MVQDFKMALKKMPEDSLDKVLARYLLTQHITPHTTTGRAPSELLMGRRLTCLLDRVHPNFSKKMKEKQEDQCSTAAPRRFNSDDPIFIRSYTAQQKWEPATVAEATGPLSYKVLTPEGKLLKRHSDQIRDRELSEEMKPEADGSLHSPTDSEDADVPQRSTEDEVAETPTPRPSRIRKLPLRLKDFDLRMVRESSLEGGV